MRKSNHIEIEGQIIPRPLKKKDARKWKKMLQENFPRENINIIQIEMIRLPCDYCDGTGLADRGQRCLKPDIEVEDDCPICEERWYFDYLLETKQ
jgi:hypothetical protein